MAIKYAIEEIERRWIVPDDKVQELAVGVPRTIEDIFITDTYLRLRKITSVDGTVYKLCKKYGHSGAYSEPIVNIYLAESEYYAMCSLPGKRVDKKRYAVMGGSLDVFYSGHRRTAIFEVEFETVEQAQAYMPPAFVGQETGSYTTMI